MDRDRFFWEDKPTPISPIGERGCRITLHLDLGLYRTLLQVAREQRTDIETAILRILSTHVRS